jgi:Immunity protein 50
MWTDFIENPKSLFSIFGEEIVSLSNAKLVETKIEYGLDLNISIRFDLSQYPSNPPKKWVINQNNTVQLTLNLVAAEIILFKTPKITAFIGTINITKNLDILSISFTDTEDENEIFMFKSKFIYLNNLTSYCNEK